MHGVRDSHIRVKPPPGKPIDGRNPLADQHVRTREITKHRLHFGAGFGLGFGLGLSGMGFPQPSRFGVVMG